MQRRQSLHDKSYYQQQLIIGDIAYMSIRTLVGVE